MVALLPLSHGLKTVSCVLWAAHKATNHSYRGKLVNIRYHLLYRCRFSVSVPTLTESFFSVATLSLLPLPLSLSLFLDLSRLLCVITRYLLTKNKKNKYVSNLCSHFDCTKVTGSVLLTKSYSLCVRP